MIDLEAAEDAIVEWFAKSLDLREDHVVWSEQSGKSVDAPSISLRFVEGPTEVGSGWKKYERDGSDTVVKLQNHFIARLEVQYFVSDVTTEMAARGQLAKAMQARALPSIADALALAHVGLGPMTAIRFVSGSSTFDPRAICEISIHLGGELSETIDTIEHVELTVELDDQAGDAVASTTEVIDLQNP